MNSERRGICYLCGNEGIVTDDHVPPRCLAPKANNSLFYKLPACETCNKVLSVQESRFRDYVVAYTKDGIPEAEAAFGNMMRNFARGKVERGGLPNRDFYRLHNNIVVREGYTPSGIYVGRVFGIKPPDDLDYKDVLRAFPNSKTQSAGCRATAQLRHLAISGTSLSRKGHESAKKIVIGRGCGVGWPLTQ